MLWATLLLLLLLRCPWGGHGEPDLEGPAQVRFVAETFHHQLHWEPGTNYTPEARYDVQYKRYGNPRWTPASHCARTASHSCDLTNQTLDPLQRYYARVRMVTGNRTSSWTHSSSHFSPKEATLWLSNVSLSVTCNKIHVTLRLPVNRWKTLTTSEDIHQRWLEYHVYVRRASDGRQSVYVNTSLEFDLPPLLWGERYCVSVEPHVVSRPNPGKRTEEQCISIPPMEDRARTIVLPSFSLLSLAALGTFGMVWACVYVKKPTKTPSVLKSLLKSGSPWVPNELPALGIKDLVFCMEVESVQHLSLSPQNCTKPDSLNHRSAGTAAPTPEESCWLPALQTRGTSESLGLRDVVDSSGCSTDSGICLQEVSGSLSHFLDCSRVSLGSHEEEGGVQEDSAGFCVKEDQVLQLVLSSRKMEELALEVEESQKPADPPQALISGYQKQLGGLSEALGSSQTLPSRDEMAHSPPGLASGYLKQPSFVIPSGPGDMTLTKDIPGKTQHFAATVSPAALGLLEWLPDCPKTLLPGSFLGPPASPHLSLLHPSCTQLSLDLDLPRCRM